MGIGHALENKEPIDWPSFMIKHMARIADPQPGSHQLAYGNLLTIVFKEFVVPLDQVPIASPRAFGPVASLLRDLRTVRDQLAVLHAENASLRADLLASLGEVTKLQE
ncbi:hypothetical protein KY284_005468 [Solanum tuberosum]|nr:hypothetical protein KY284_005468 [Solanum tuberosum]